MDRNEQSPPQTIRLSDYAPPAFKIEHADLTFHLDRTRTRVISRLKFERTLAGGQEPLILDGEGLTSISISIDGVTLAEDAYQIVDNTLTIQHVGDRFLLETEVEIDPAANTALSGLYASSGNLCTQCEAEGFRRITWFLDRPDVLSRYRTTLIANRNDYPVLLANGNPIEQGDNNDGNHYVVWDDPWPKPSYLFALVGGKLEFVEKALETASGKAVRLRVYAEPHNVDKCDYALVSLENALRWDEQVYGREYDLDIYNVVAVDDFNMGAMENKGLNVFNSKYVLASPATATDADYQNIEGVIGHEYFHNWSGNRVTCRDWFQLSLKEGFTVFRDQQFSAATASEGVKRIQDVNILRTHQFREDAGPMAHPVQPSQYVEINNFYTVTIYNKGAEIVRMLYQLAGAKGFRRGTDLYFERHDGEAVTIDDFIAAIGEGSGLDLVQFKRWYHQAGTPHVHMTRSNNGNANELTLKFTQSCPDTPDQSNKQPFHIPLAFAMIGADGTRQPLRFGANDDVTVSEDGRSSVLHLKHPNQQFSLHDLNEAAVPSVLRAFSTPVKLETDLDDSELTLLMAYDDDPFNRWESGQRLASSAILAKAERNDDAQWQTFSEAFAVTLQSPISDLAFKAEALSLPSQTLLAESMQVIKPDSLHSAHRSFRLYLATEHRQLLEELYQAHSSSDHYQPDSQSAGRRALRNVCLDYLSMIGDEPATALAEQQFQHADNMTDQFAAFRCLAHHQSKEVRQTAVNTFYAQWQSEPLVIDKWFSAQANRAHADAVEEVRQLAGHADFDEKNPNRARSLYAVFAAANMIGFHRADGQGYALVGDFVRRLDEFNPQVAARMISSFLQWRRFNPERQQAMRQQLEKTLESPNISKDVFEIVSRSLAD